MQGYLLEIIAHGVSILSLIKNLKWAIPDVTQPWYSYNNVALGAFAILDTYSDLLTEQGPGWGYHPEPSKSVLIVRLDNPEVVKVFGRRQ